MLKHVISLCIKWTRNFKMVWGQY